VNWWQLKQFLPVLWLVPDTVDCPPTSSASSSSFSQANNTAIKPMSNIEITFRMNEQIS
jgi:hypothetical protein